VTDDNDDIDERLRNGCPPPNDVVAVVVADAAADAWVMTVGADVVSDDDVEVEDVGLTGL
jgi:hypothetical protein